MGRCRHRPLQSATKIQRILKGGQSRPPLQMTVKNRTGHAKTAAFPILRRRGRCPHRPAGNDRFMAAFRRNRVHFLFYAVGADDPVRPQETPVFTKNRCEIATFSMGRCRHRPLQTATKIQRILKGGQSRPPAGKCPFSRKTDAKLQHFQWADVGIGPYDRQRKISRFCGRTESSAPTNGIW